MDRMGYARGLIRYTSQNALEGAVPHVVRPRMLVYGVLLAALVVGFFVSISLRTPVGLDVMRDRNALYRRLPDGSIENVYLLRILNKDTAAHVYRLAADGLPGLQLDAGDAGREVEDGEQEHAHEQEDGVAQRESSGRVGPGEVFSLPVRVRAPPGTASGSREIRFEVVATDAPRLRASRAARFLAP
jgi:polyferredoxin